MNITTEFVIKTLANLASMKQEATGENLETLENAETIINSLFIAMEARKREKGV